MEKAKKIKSADQALQSISFLLSFPHNMKLALNSGNYEEVLIISKKVQILSPGNVLSSAKILSQVQLTAASIVNNLKEKCIEVLLGIKKVEKEVEKDEDINRDNLETSNIDNDDDVNNENEKEHAEEKIKNIPQINILSRFSKLLYEIEGEEKEKNNLKLCFYKQLNNFGEEIQKYRKKFYENSKQAVKDGKIIFKEKNNQNQNGNGNDNQSNQNKKNKFNDENEETVKNSSNRIYENENYENNQNHKNYYGDKNINNEKNNTFSINNFRGQNNGDDLGSDWMPIGVSVSENIILKNCIKGKINKVAKGSGRGRGRGREMGTAARRGVEKRGSGGVGVGSGGGGVISEEISHIEFGLSEEEEEEEEEEGGGDGDEVDEGRGSDRGSGNGRGTGNGGDYNEKTRVNRNENGNENDDDDGLYLFSQRKENYYCDLYCSRVRLLYVLRVVRAMDAWTHVLAQ